MQSTERLSSDPAGLHRAADLLRAGQLVAFPTETVYGLGADATNDTSVAKIFAAKDRPAFNPLIVHVSNIEKAREIALFNDLADRLAVTFWPGALTLVLPRRPDADIASLASAGLPTIAIRIPDHPLAQELLGHVDRPIAAPSANPSGRVSPTTADHVIAGLSGQIAAVLDGGPSPVGVESTIVGTDRSATLLRPGGLPAEAIEACLGAKLNNPDTFDAITAPGQMASHYATNARIRLNAASAQHDETLLGFGPVAAKFNLSPSGDLVEAAANLFGLLHQIDKTAAKIAVSPIPDHGLGRAINDRLRRAAAPRP